MLNASTFAKLNGENRNHLAGYILDTIPTAIYTCDQFGYITAYNKAAVELWGREPVLGEDLWCGSWKIFTPAGEPLPLDTCPMARALKDGKPVTGEEIVVERPDRERRNVLPYPVPMFDEQGHITGAINTLVDITEQRQSETRQSVLAAIIDSSQDAIISKTLDGVIISWNRGAEAMFGYTEAEMLGDDISKIIPEHLQDEEDRIIDKVRSGEQLGHYQTLRRTKSGKLLAISLTVSPIRDGRGQIIGASKIARDITLQKENERALRRNAKNLETLNSIGKVISEDLDTQAILQKVTDATTQLAGAAFGAFFYNSVNEHGESYKLFTLSGASRESFEKFGMPRNTDVFHPTFSGDGILRVDDITKDPRYGKNHPHYGMPKGHLPVVSFLSVPVVSKSGKVIGGLFFGHPDAGMFTQEHENLIAGVAYQAALALDNAQLFEEVKVLNAKKDEFIGLASHELKTPVTTISGYVQILAKNVEDATSKRFAEKALQQIDKLTALVTDLLDVSKIQTGNLPLTYSTFNLAHLVEEVIEMEKYTNSPHRINLTCEESDLNVYADKQRIEQVLINLISNAVKYSPNADHLNIRIDCSADKVTVAVRDFGIGIAKEQQERIFSRFYRVEAQSGNFSGLGIGLYICHEIIQRHGGRLWVESVPGEGSEFFFQIPIAAM